MGTNIAQFEREILRFEREELPKQIVQFHKKIHFEALSRIVQKTPVDTGRARGNWQSSISTPNEGEIERVDRGGQIAIDEGLDAVSGLRPFGISFIFNNVPYIGVLEDGSSTQAPQGMVSVTIGEIESAFGG